MSRYPTSGGRGSESSPGRNGAGASERASRAGRSTPASAGRHAGAASGSRIRVPSENTSGRPSGSARTGSRAAGASASGARAPRQNDRARTAPRDASRAYPRNVGAGAADRTLQQGAARSGGRRAGGTYGAQGANGALGAQTGVPSGVRNGARTGASGVQGGFPNSARGARGAQTGTQTGAGNPAKRQGLFAFVEDRFGRGVAIGLRIALALLILFAVFLAVDAIRFRSKIYPNVTVGSVDVGGMTVEEAERAIYEAYAPIVAGNSIAVFANENAKAKVESAAGDADSDAVWNALSDAQANGLAWSRSATELNATVASQALAESAYGVGREDGGILGRIALFVLRSNVEPYPIFDETAVEELAQEVDATLGEPRVDSYVVIQDGVASAYAGNDGFMTSRSILHERLNVAFMAQTWSADTNSYVATAEYAPQRIVESQAQDTAQFINSAIANGAVVSYQGVSWNISRESLGSYTETKVEEADEGYRLVPYLRTSTTQADLLSSATEATGQESITVSFTKEADGSVMVHPASSTGRMPNVAAATKELDDALYGDAATADPSVAKSAPKVQIDEEKVPGSLSFEEAYEEGIVMLISSYTTSYTTGTESRNNRNFNIRRCADFIDESICTANGGTWNFNETTGECNEAAGFKNAGIIQDGLHTDAFGGGICQVATTLFNAVFEAGYPVTERHNHTLYPDNYPAGRDAAVDYGGYNFIWQNDTSSDVLVKTSHGDTTITVDLYGVSPRLHVEAEVSDWVDYGDYKTKTYVDETLAESVDYVVTKGENGGYLHTTRKIYDASNTLVRTDVFTSNYEAQNEIRIIGYGEEAQALIDSGQATLLTDELRAML